MSQIRQSLISDREWWSSQGCEVHLRTDSDGVSDWYSTTLECRLQGLLLTFNLHVDHMPMMLLCLRLMLEVHPPVMTLEFSLFQEKNGVWDSQAVLMTQSFLPTKSDFVCVHSQKIKPSRTTNDWHGFKRPKGRFFSEKGNLSLLTHSMLLLTVF